jgi:energy-coupling factor transporter ATP-binding protein EcfA2
MARADQARPAPWPSWLEELDDFLIVHPQLVFAGNIHDVYLVPNGGDLASQKLAEAVSTRLVGLGFDLVLSYDRVDRLKLIRGKPADADEFVGQHAHGGTWKKSVPELGELAKKVVASAKPRIALLIYFSRLPPTTQQLYEEFSGDLLSTCEKLAYTATPISSASHKRRFNPIIWIVDSLSDLPTWFAGGNHGIRTKLLPIPDFATRAMAAGKVAEWFDALPSPAARERAVALFAGLTDGMPLSALFAIADLALARGIGFDEIGQAIQRFKIGIADNPWRDPHLKGRVAAAEQEIAKRVKGQAQAIEKAADILRRSVAGLTGAQGSAASAANRPKGIMFFVGPTGVGKTELAKAISELIFLNEDAYLRFDMSEFSADHTQARLIGAPPGYIGYDAGGELTNGIREKPFSVVLFDEIDKAHPRILDKFLQILEDGRLTDGRGETAYFSEAVIIFTSNLASFIEKEVLDERGHRYLVREPRVHPGLSYREVEEKMREAVVEHFTLRIGRPEILNRIGNNIVVFDFIRRDVAHLIFDKMISNVIQTVKERLGIELVLRAEARSKLQDLCTGALQDGGRGIGNRLETIFINPLSRRLFDHPQGRVEVVEMREKGGRHEVVLK